MATQNILNKTSSPFYPGSLTISGNTIQNTGGTAGFTCTDTSKSFYIYDNTADREVVLEISNTGNTSALNRTTFSPVCTDAKDGYFKFVASDAGTWTFGYQTTNASNPTKICSTATLSDTAEEIALQIERTGEVTMPAQPAFLTRMNTTQSNITGTGTVADVIFDTIVAEHYKTTHVYNTATGVFTCPRTGKYLFESGVTVSGFDQNSDEIQLRLVTTARTYYSGYINPYTASSSDGYYTVLLSTLADMTAGDTAKIQLMVAGTAADSCDVLGDASIVYSYFSGNLTC